MDTAIKRARVVKIGFFGTALAAVAFFTQITTFSSNAAAIENDQSVVQVKRLSAPTVSTLWSDYESVFLEQKNGIVQAASKVETATVEIEKLIAAIDQDASEFSFIVSNKEKRSDAVRLGLASPNF
ncbi:MAG: hypothetical protein KTR18_10210 [Acidiferrobacterales bacterium]|nr:hypothetical protein [Acidiferrobacterales bacterium]